MIFFDEEQKRGYTTHTDMPLFTLFQNKSNAVPKIHRSNDTAEQQRRDWNLFEEGQLLVDVIEQPDSIVIRSLVAGIDPDKLEISLHNDLLTIRGTRREQEDVYDDQYLIRECYWGNFSRSIIIPVPVQTQKIQALFKNGVVTITLPKAECDNSIPLTENSSQETDDESPYWEDEEGQP